MDNKEAIELLERIVRFGFVEKYDFKFTEAIDFAIDKLKEDEWIPVSDPPKEDEDVLMDMGEYVYSGKYEQFGTGKWGFADDEGYIVEDVKYWKKLPKSKESKV
jgi:hypothetical protein